MSDFDILDHGSIVILRPRSPEASAWVEQHIWHDDETQYFGGGVVVEPRYMARIVNGIYDDGLTVRVL